MNRMIDTTTIDPITLEVVRNKVDGIANEMQSTLLRSSFSTVVKEAVFFYLRSCEVMRFFESLVSSACR